MRITENMMTSTYNRNLQRNISDLASSNLKLSSKRQYNHVSEDPATASKAFAIRDQIARSEEHISVVKNARGELDTADSNIVTLNSILETVYEKATKAGGASSQDSMDAIAEELGGLKEEILQTMNAKYGDKFLFSGSSNSEAPFTVDGDRWMPMIKMIRIRILRRISRFIWISDSVHTRREPTRQRQELRFPHQAWMCWDTERTRTGFPTICTAS